MDQRTYRQTQRSQYKHLFRSRSEEHDLRQIAAAAGGMQLVTIAVAGPRDRKLIPQYLSDTTLASMAHEDVYTLRCQLGA